ncbi:hypothetical protein Tco_0190380 [Tanacetum coccineum]
MPLRDKSKNEFSIYKVWKSVGVSNGLDMAYWGFLRVGTTFDIFQNIILIPYLEYGVLSLLDTPYCSLIFCGLWYGYSSVAEGDLRKFSDIRAWEVPSFDGLEPQPLLNSPSLDVSLGDVIGLEPPIKPHSPDSSRMKVVDYLTTQTLPSPHMANSHPKGVYSYCNPCINEPKRHYGFKPSLLGKSVSLGVDIFNWEMFDDDWGLESKEVSLLGEELSLFDRPNEVERGRILEAHCLETILQQ